MRDALVDTFSIQHNDSPIATGVVAASANAAPQNPSSMFTGLSYDPAGQEVGDAISKLESTESVFESDHGSGAAMKDHQKRELHIRSILSLRSDDLREIKVQIFKPIGSVFQFLSDGPNNTRVPSGQILVSAGIAFCFMTQIGRYAGIVKKDLADYGIVQDIVFDLENGKTLPVDTHAFLSSAEDNATAQQYIDMAEQTCFLHGACRMSNKTRLTIA